MVRGSLCVASLAPLLLAAASAADPPRFEKAYVVLDFMTASPKFEKKHTRDVCIDGRKIGAVPYHFCRRWNYYWTRFHRVEIPDPALVKDGLCVSISNLFGYVANLHVELVKKDGTREYSTLDTTRYTDITMPSWAYPWRPFDTRYVPPGQPIVSQPLHFGDPGPEVAPRKGLTRGLHILRLKRNFPDTYLARAGRPASMMVTDETVAGRALGECVVRCVREQHGVELPLTTRRSLSVADAERWNVIFLGPPVDGLYTYYVRTYHDPYGFGVNQVYVGGATNGGLSEGVEVLLSRLRSGQDTVFLPRTFELKPNDYAARCGEEPGDLLHFQLLKATSARAASALVYADRLLKDRDALASGQEIKQFWPTITTWVQRYYISGDRRFMEAARKGYLALAEFLEREKDPRDRYRDWHDDTHAYWFKLMAYWDLLEEEGAFTDQERLRITQTLLRFMADRVQTVHCLQRPPWNNHGMRWSFQNHESGGPVASMAAIAYFGKHYPTLEWTNEWRAEQQMMMARQARCYSTNENTKGYQFYGMEHVQLYMDYSHDKRYLYSGNLYRLATEHIIKHDNLGYASVQVGGGGGISPRPGYLHLAADLYGEGKFNYLTPRLNLGHALVPTQPRLDKGNYYARTMVWRRTDPGSFRDQTLPVDHVGVKPLFLDRGLYHEVLHSHYGYPKAEHGGRSIPRAKALNKLSFRSGFHPDDDLLVIDGWGARGAHSTNTGNAIVSYTSDRRLWLTRARDRRKEDLRVEINNSVTVKFNGEDRPPSPFTGLEYLGDFVTAAMTNTSKIAYNRCDWHRRVFQVKNKFFVVMDQIIANEKGRFDIKTHWHVPGRSYVDRNRVRVAQIGDARLELVNVSGHMQRSKRLPSFICTPFYRKTATMYPYVDAFSKVLSFHERNQRDLEVGGSAWSVNVLYSYLTREEEQTFEARPVGENRVALRRGDGTWLVGVGGLSGGGLQTDAEAYIFSHEGFCGVGVTRATVDGSPLFECSQPVGAEILLSGRAIVTAEAPVTVWLYSGRDRRLVWTVETF